MTDAVERALPPLLLELDETLTEELDDEDDDEADELAAFAKDLPPELFDMLLVSRPAASIRTTAQSSGMLI